jgi:hypothetical protein
MVARLPKNTKAGVVSISAACCKNELSEKTNYKTYAAMVAPCMTNMIKEYGGNPYAYSQKAG